MAHFAKINNENIVEDVIVVADKDCGGGEYPASDNIGNVFLNSIGLSGTWKQTSYNAKFRKSYAGIGFTYNAANDVFIAPKPFPSWTLDAEFNWQAPTQKPSDGQTYIWNEESLSWELIVIT